jgi:SAM-dependent methyltransferase
MRDAPALPTPDTAVEERNRFWTGYQPGFRSTAAEIGSERFYAEVERRRYELEPAIPEIVGFPRWAGRDVLEAGCGIATDGINFARADARYTGVDFSTTALELARRRFESEERDGRFVRASITELPFEDSSFDLVYSNGVIHHLPETERVVREFHRVLRPGGRAIVMVYHRDSLNLWLNIMGVRRALVGLLVMPGAERALARLTGEDRSVLQGHRALLREHRLRYLTDRQLFLNNNTDGPGNPLSKAYSRHDGRRLFADFERVSTRVRFLNLRLYPMGERLASSGIGRQLEPKIGWHLWLEGVKGDRPLRAPQR